MPKKRTSLAGQLLDSYQSGDSVSSLCADNGLTEEAIVIRLCAASHIYKDDLRPAVDEEGCLGIQWRLVFWRA